MNNFDEIQSFKIHRLSSFSLPLICNLKNLENDIRFRTRGWKRRKTVGGNVSGIKYADGTRNDKTWKDIRPFFETKEGREFFNIEERGKLSTSISN